MENNGIWEEKYTIEANMVDTSCRATMTSICNFLQIAAGNHAHFRGIGFEGMSAAGHFWVLNRLLIEMDEMPAWRTSISVQTWVHSMKGPFSYRNFEICGENGKRIGAGSTLWVALDAETRKPVRINTDGFPILEDKQPICGEPSKIKPIVIGEERMQATEHQVVYSDLDMINHVNNTKYIEWILDTYGVWNKENKVKRLEVNYLNETHSEETVLIISNAAKKEAIHQHQLCRKSDNKEVVRAIVKWDM